MELAIIMYLCVTDLHARFMILIFDVIAAPHKYTQLYNNSNKKHKKVIVFILFSSNFTVFSFNFTLLM